jgi:hypothetical protein
MLARILALALAIYPALAFAQSAVLNAFPPGVFQNRAAIDAGGGPPPLSPVVFQASGSSTNTSLTTLDYGTLVNSGTGNRTVLVIQFYENSTTVITGVTINGVALTQVPGAFANQARAGSTAIDVWESTSVLSGDVQVTYSTTLNFSSAVALYSLNTTTPTVSSVGPNFTLAAPSLSSSVTVPSGGGGIVAVSTAAGQVTTGITNAAVDAVLTPGGAGFTFAHTTATGATTITASWATSDDASITSAAWGP